MKPGGEHGSCRFGLGAWPTVLQASLTAVLLVGAGLFTRSLERARTIPLGFSADRVVVGEVQWAAASGLDPAHRAALRGRREQVLQRALERVRQVPLAETAALAVGSPFGNSFGVRLFVPGWDSLPSLKGGGPYVAAVTDGYFATVGTRLRRGRTFTPTEGNGTEPVAIVNETMARTLWPGRDAIGQCIKVGADTAPCASVVGIVEDARRYQLKEDPAMQYYIPLGQERGFGGTVLMARSRGTAAALVAPLVATMSAAGAEVERATAAPLQESIDPLLRPWRLGATIFSMGGILALLVAALGLYSVMSYSVAQRTHEMGVRMALGARAGHIVGLVVRQSMTMAAVGVAVGIAVALYAGRFVQQLLFDTSPRDPSVLGGAVALLLAVAVAASVVPALRARRVDPMRALKSE